MSMMIPIEELIQDKCYEVESADYKALVEVDIINGEYCGRNYKTPIKAIDAVPMQQIAQIKYEIYQEVGNIDRSQYTTESARKSRWNYLCTGNGAWHY